MLDEQLEQVDDSLLPWLLIHSLLVGDLVHNEGVCHKIVIDKGHIQLVIGSNTLTWFTTLVGMSHVIWHSHYRCIAMQPPSTFPIPWCAHFVVHIKGVKRYM